MPRYFFDVLDDGRLARDAFGVDLPDIAEVRDHAIGLLPDIARDELPDGERHDFACEVRNDAGRIVYRARLTLRAGTVDEPARPADGKP